MTLTGQQALNVVYALNARLTSPEEELDFAKINSMTLTIEKCEIEGHDWKDELDIQNKLIGVKCSVCKVQICHKLSEAQYAWAEKKGSLSLRTRILNKVVRAAENKSLRITKCGNKHVVIYDGDKKRYMAMNRGHHSYWIFSVWDDHTGKWNELKNTNQ